METRRLDYSAGEQLTFAQLLTKNRQNPHDFLCTITACGDLAFRESPLLGLVIAATKQDRSNMNSMGNLGGIPPSLPNFRREFVFKPDSLWRQTIDSFHAAPGEQQDFMYKEIPNLIFRVRRADDRTTIFSTPAMLAFSS